MIAARGRSFLVPAITTNFRRSSFRCQKAERERGRERERERHASFLYTSWVAVANWINSARVRYAHQNLQDSGYSHSTRRTVESGHRMKSSKRLVISVKSTRARTERVVDWTGLQFANWGPIYKISYDNLTIISRWCQSYDQLTTDL